MTQTVQDLVQHALSGDALKASDAFNGVIVDRIASAIDAKKIELAQSYFASEQDDEDEVEDFVDDDQDDNVEEEEEEDENS